MSPWSVARPFPCRLPPSGSFHIQENKMLSVCRTAFRHLGTAAPTQKQELHGDKARLRGQG